MNKDEILRVANDIEQDHTSFGMAHIHKLGAPCNTPGCIIGYTVMHDDSIETNVAEETATVLLDLSPTDSMELFAPQHSYAHFQAEPGQGAYITWDHAVRCLRNLAETGEVDWKCTK